jgi:hypothetical protein
MVDTSVGGLLVPEGMVDTSVGGLLVPEGMVETSVLAPKDIFAIWFTNRQILSLSDEGYSRNASCALILISTFFKL